MLFSLGAYLPLPTDRFAHAKEARTTTGADMVSGYLACCKRDCRVFHTQAQQVVRRVSEPGSGDSIIVTYAGPTITANPADIAPPLWGDLNPHSSLVLRLYALIQKT